MNFLDTILSDKSRRWEGSVSHRVLGEEKGPTTSHVTPWVPRQAARILLGCKAGRTAARAQVSAEIWLLPCSFGEPQRAREGPSPRFGMTASLGI